MDVQGVYIVALFTEMRNIGKPCQGIGQTNYQTSIN